MTDSQSETCPHCNAQLPSTADAFCSSCGNAVLLEAEAVPTSEPLRSDHDEAKEDANPYRVATSFVTPSVGETAVVPASFRRFLISLGLVALSFFIPAFALWLILSTKAARESLILGLDPIATIRGIITFFYVTFAIWVVTCDFTESPYARLTLGYTTKFFSWIFCSGNPRLGLWTCRTVCNKSIRFAGYRGVVYLSCARILRSLDEPSAQAARQLLIG